MHNVDRRNLLLGLGGLYGAANIGSALADPVITPADLSKCVAATIKGDVPKNAVRGVACCPPFTDSKPEDYTLPDVGTKLRTRPAAHRLSPEYIKKYELAIKKMKDLPETDPHSWKQQASIHCAYCNGGYKRQLPSGDIGTEILQVHNSSLFFPFHRWYLYFLERIMGSLIEDPDFAIPYWNWDNPAGMMLPAVFEAPVINDKGKPDPRANPLFDPFRNVAHLPPSVVDLNYRTDTGAFCVDQISANLSLMYNQMCSSAKTTDAFFGTDPDHKDEDGKKDVQAGSIERGCHTAVHIWVGNPRMPYNEDMGNFYSAGYDPAFYAHHGNVDRMWKIWKDLSPSNKDPTSKDWLDSSYLFYNEKKELVRVYNRDCVDIKKMGYDYENSIIPWKSSRPVPDQAMLTPGVVRKSAVIVPKAEEIKSPLNLDQTVKVKVKRPAKMRSEDEKTKATEILFVKGIKYRSDQFFKFDVLVNDVDNGMETTPASSQFAGTFGQVPHNHGDEMFMTSGASFGITELLEDIKAENSEYVLVTLVPRAGTDGATVSEIR